MKKILSFSTAFLLTLSCFVSLRAQVSPCTGIVKCGPSTNCNCGSGCSEYPGGPGYTILAQCSTTGTYNCHQYTRAALNSSGFGSILIPNCYAYGGNCPCGNYASSAINSDPAFVKVCSIGLAQAIYYDNDHSGIFNLNTTSDPNDVISKWNSPGPLTSHSKDYYPGNQSFYAYIGGISPSGGTITGATPFSVRDRAGLSYSWSASPAGKVTISNANTYNPTITPVCAGTVQISVTVTSQGMEGCTGGSSTQCVTITSAPASGGCNCAIPCTISGTYISNGTTYPLNTFNNTYSYGTNVNVSCSSATTFTWTKTSGNGTFVVLNGSGSSISVYLNAGQTISLNVVAKDANGCTVGSRTVAFSRSSGMINPGMEEGISFEKIQYQSVLAELAIFPNPTEGILNIYAGNCESLDIEVFSSVGQRLLYVRDQPIDSYSRVDLRILPEGIYILKVGAADGSTRNFKVMIEKR